MGVGIKTSVGNPSNVRLEVPVHVAQGACGMFTELQLLHMYILYPQPFGLVISQHLRTWHTHTYVPSAKCTKRVWCSEQHFLSHRVGPIA